MQTAKRHALKMIAVTLLLILSGCATSYSYKWSELKDIRNVMDRKLANKVVLTVHPGEPTRYTVAGASGKRMTFAEGKIGFINISGKNHTATSWSGYRNGEYLDDGFYAFLGVGTEIRLPNDWVSIFGIRCKNGKMFIRKDGIKLSSDTQKDDYR